MKNRGRISNEDLKFIQDECDRMSLDEIAAELDRPAKRIKPLFDKALEEKKEMLGGAVEVDTEVYVSPDEEEKFVITADLKSSETWKRIKQEFTEEELKYFEEQYVKLLSQFKDDVLATEDTQIVQAIKFDLLMSRNMIQRKKMNEDIDHLEDLQAQILESAGGNLKFMPEAQRKDLLDLETNLNNARSTEAAKTNEYTKLQERHAKLMEALKATRDQRLDRIEKAGINFTEVLKSFQKKDVQEAEGRQNELMKLGTQKEYMRLGRPHVYMDGVIDSPILSVDTVDLPPLEGDEANVGIEIPKLGESQ